MTKPKMIEINAEHIRAHLKDRGIPVTELSEKLGKEKTYVNGCLTKGRMEVTAFRLLCVLTQLDEKRATGATKKEEAADDALMLHTELILDDIKEVGKICDDVKREIRESRTQTKELLEKLYNAFHSLDVFLRNACPEIRDQHRAANNVLNQMNNYIQKKGEQQCRR